MSPSIINTRFPNCAREIAKLLHIVVFPSEGSALTKTTDRGGRAALESRTDVRRLRNASERAEPLSNSESTRIQLSVDCSTNPPTLPFPPSPKKLRGNNLRWPFFS